ncbi:hypothetical protein XENOCAPTIV_024304, partial [Xenoophorus captivus]
DITHLFFFVSSYLLMSGEDAKDAPVHPGPAVMSFSAVGRHGDCSGAGVPLHAAADHPSEDAAAAPPLQPQRASECEQQAPVSSGQSAGSIFYYQRSSELEYLTRLMLGEEHCETPAGNCSTLTFTFFYIFQVDGL